MYSNFFFLLGISVSQSLQAITLQKQKTLEFDYLPSLAFVTQLGVEMARDLEASPSRIEIAWANFIICG
jgi:hypothetical protein